MAEHINKQQTVTPMPGYRGGGRNPFAPGAKPKNAKGTLFRILKIYLRWAKPLLIVIVLTVISSLISVAIPYYLGLSFNTFHISDRSVDIDKLIQILCILISMYVVSWLANFLNGFLALRVSQRLVFTLRGELFAKMQKLPLEFYDTRSHGDTMSRMTNDMDNISSVIAQTTTQMVSSIVTLIGSLTVMIYLNLPLTLVVLLCIPLVTLLTKIISSKSRTYFKAQQRSLGYLNGVIEENIIGLKMVKAFDRQEEVIRRFQEINEELCENNNKAQKWSGYMMPLMNVINNLIFAVVSITGGICSIRYGLSVGTVISFLNYSKQFSQPLNSIAVMYNNIQSALAGAERVFEILDYKEETPDETDAIEVSDPVGEVIFQDICFSYDKENLILKDINFHVKPGEVVALVGETGSGKTTIVNLLTRFYDADSGVILIDNIPITSIRRDNLRRCFSVVLQDTSLFSGTIMENIRYSNVNATNEEVIRAAKIAHAHDFIEKLPKEYDTFVSSTTDNLSQGQRQLISIARAVLSNSPILILDEATSSVDTKTEKEIQKALVSLMGNRTSFLIAHRLSTIRDANHILVIGNGQILEYGNHQSLMMQRGRYYEMVMSQMGRSIALL